jgi:hypothetical protein
LSIFKKQNYAWKLPYNIVTFSKDFVSKSYLKLIMPSIVDVQYRTIYNAVIPSSSQFLWISDALSNPGGQILLNNPPQAGVIAPSVGSLNDLRYDIAWKPGQANITIIFTYPIGSVYMAADDPLDDKFNTSVLTFGPYNVAVPVDRTITINTAATASGTTPPTINPGQSISIYANGLFVGSINQLFAGTFSYTFPLEVMTLYYDIDSFGLTVRLRFWVEAIGLGLPAKTDYQGQDWLINAMQEPMTLTITDMNIDYVPTSLNGFNMVITVPVGGLEWLSSNGAVPGPNPNSTPILITIPLSFPGISRTIYNYFALDPFPNLISQVILSGANSLVLSSGATEVPVPAVPSTSPSLITVVPFCIHPDSMVHTSKGLIRLGDIRKDQNIELIDANGKLVPLLFNAEFAGSAEFVKYAKDSLGQNMPDCDLYMTEGHPILHNNLERVSKRMINNETVKLVNYPSDFTYALVTEKRTFTLINNVPVCTWALTELQTNAKKAGIYYKLI